MFSISLRPLVCYETNNVHKELDSYPVNIVLYRQRVDYEERQDTSGPQRVVGDFTELNQPLGKHLQQTSA